MSGPTIPRREDRRREDLARFRDKDLSAQKRSGGRRKTIKHSDLTITHVDLAIKKCGLGNNTKMWIKPPKMRFTLNL